MSIVLNNSQIKNVFVLKKEFIDILLFKILKLNIKIIPAGWDIKN